MLLFTATTPAAATFAAFQMADVTTFSYGVAGMVAGEQEMFFEMGTEEVSLASWDPLYPVQCSEGTRMVPSGVMPSKAA